MRENFLWLFNKFDGLELMTFIISLLVFITILYFFKQKNIKTQEKRFFLYSYTGIVLALFFTNVEEILFPVLFNLFEHLFYLIASLLFLIGILTYKKDD